MLSVGFRVITDIRRPPESVVHELDDLPSCDISDVLRRSHTLVGLAPVYQPIGRAVGPAVTVSIPAGGINMVKMGIEQTRPGDVLVVSVNGATQMATWGG